MNSLWTSGLIGDKKDFIIVPNELINWLKSKLNV